MAKQHGGKREGAGRKPRAEEQKLIEKLSPLEPLAHAKLKEAIEATESWAVQMYFNYMYGKPKERKDITTNGESLNVPIINIDPLADAESDDSTKEDS